MLNPHASHVVQLHYKKNLSGKIPDRLMFIISQIKLKIYSEKNPLLELIPAAHVTHYKIGQCSQRTDGSHHIGSCSPF